MLFRSGLGMSSAVLQLNAKGEYTLFVGVTDVGAGAKTTMGLIAAEALNVPLSKVNVIWGDTDRCPYSVGESGSRTTIQTGTAVMEAVKDMQKQVADKGMPNGDQVYVAKASPNPRLEGKQRAAFGAHYCEVEVDTELGGVKVTKYTTVHDSGRIMNPLSAKGQIAGAVVQGIGMTAPGRWSEELGRLATETLVLLHSATSAGREDWAAQVPLLAREFRLLLPDARGHATTAWDAADGWSAAALVDDLEAFLDSLDDRASEYIPGIAVDRLEDSSSGVKVTGRETRSRQDWSLRADRVFLAAGVLGGLMVTGRRRAPRKWAQGVGHAGH